MKIICKFSVAFICLTVLCAAVRANEKVKVGIDYNGVHETREAEAQWTEGVTALEVLESVAQIETHQVKDHIFVTSIDGVKGKRGDMAWYYEINGERADKLAFRRVLNKDDSTKWIYKQDVCSSKVDK